MSWYEKAKCLGFPTKWWFPEQGGRTDLPVWICKNCSVQAECLDYAMKFEQPVHGIWGGTTESQRTKLKIEARTKWKAGT